VVVLCFALFCSAEALRASESFVLGFVEQGRIDWFVCESQRVEVRGGGKSWRVVFD